MAREKLNVLWIITDEQRTDSLGCYGSRWANSANIDAVAAAGVRFENCIIQSPVCVPSRTCMMTGRYAHAFGMLENHHKPLPDETPLVRPFIEAGYQVAGFGKYHCVDPDNPFTIRGCEDRGHGGPAACPLCLAEPYKPEDHDVVFMPFKNAWGPNTLIVGGRYPLPADDNEPGAVAARCEQFLSERVFREELQGPFFLRASIAAPHTPVLPAEEFFGVTDPDAIDIPDYDDARGRPECCRYEREVLGNIYDFGPLSPAQRRQARANYYDLCTEVDAAVGRILAALDASGQAGNTLIVFTSDHGNMLGEHGIMQKETFYEEVVRVPLVISCPGRLAEGTVIPEQVETVDILPTMLSLAGLEVPGNVHGVDLSSSMRLGFGDADRVTFAEIDLSISGIPELTRNASHRVMARTNNWKLVYSWTGEGFGEDAVLYDLANDPGETANVYDDPRNADVVARLKRAVEEWQRRG